MARLKRYCPAGIPVHIIQRGNNRIDCFHEDQDRAKYFRLLKNAADKFDVRVHAWVFMSNHVHLLVTPSGPDSTSKMMQSLDREYVRFFNRKYSRTGTLWDGRFRSCLIQTERYFLICQRYIELNPVRAGIVDHPASFHWSTYKSNAMGVESFLLSPHEVYLSLGRTRRQRLAEYQALFRHAIPEAQIEELRHAVNRGLVVGTDDFKNRIEVEGGQPTRLKKRGPKPRATRI